jgi:hypothetical protein
VVTINLNAQSESPATLSYKGDPMAALRLDRERYVVAGLTIIEAYKAAGSPKTDVLPIASYNGDWADHCRHPLIWLGLPDPASVLIEQVKEDPTLQPLRSLLETWYEEFRDRPTKVSELLAVNEFSELYDALQDLPIAYKGHIDPTSLGKYLTKNKNRPVGSYILEEGPRGKRRTWCIRRVAEASKASMPPSPP